MALSVVNVDIHLWSDAAPPAYMGQAGTQGLPGGELNTPSYAPLGVSTALQPLTLNAIYRTPEPGKVPVSDGQGSQLAQDLIDLRDGTADPAAVDRIGTALWAILPDGVRDVYIKASTVVATQADTLLRVQLLIDVRSAELALLPWELLKPTAGNHSVLDDTRRSLIRVPLTQDPAPARRTDRPQRVLIWAPSPQGQAATGWQEHKAAITLALPANSQVDVEQKCTLQRWSDAVQDEGYQAVHYIGHGEFVAGPPPHGVLLFADAPDAPAHRVTAAQLDPAISNSPTLQLLFLSACQSGQGSVQDPFAAIALNLARDTPVVVAMQAPLAVDTAVLLAQEFYKHFAAGQPVDYCLARARGVIRSRQNERPYAWAIPALYTRTVLQAWAVPSDQLPAIPNPPPPSILRKLQLQQAQAELNLRTAELQALYTEYTTALPYQQPRLQLMIHQKEQEVGDLDARVHELSA
jgi:hypothetical protein